MRLLAQLLFALLALMSVAPSMISAQAIWTSPSPGQVVASGSTLSMSLVSTSATAVTFYLSDGIMTYNVIGTQSGTTWSGSIAVPFTATSQLLVSAVTTGDISPESFTIQVAASIPSAVDPSYNPCASSYSCNPCSPCRRTRRHRGCGYYADGDAQNIVDFEEGEEDLEAGSIEANNIEESSSFAQAPEIEAISA